MAHDGRHHGIYLPSGLGRFPMRLANVLRNFVPVGIEVDANADPAIQPLGPMPCRRAASTRLDA
jgi:hypothetical protein